MKLAKINNVAIKIAILAIPFELFGLSISQTFLAPSYIIQFLFLFTIFFYLKRKTNALFCIIIFIFLIITNGLFAYQELNVDRYIINAFTLLFFLLLCTKNYIFRVKINQHNYFSIFRYSVFICAFFVYLQFIVQAFLGFNFLNYIQRYSQAGRSFDVFTTRYQGLMVEPSYAGYVIACLLAYEIRIFFLLPSINLLVLNQDT
jgi:hypothetical protein